MPPTNYGWLCAPLVPRRHCSAAAPNAFRQMHTCAQSRVVVTTQQPQLEKRAPLRRRTGRRVSHHPRWQCHCLCLSSSLSLSPSVSRARSLTRMPFSFLHGACTKTASSRSCVRAACCVRLAMLTSAGVWHCCVLLSLSHSLSFSPSRSPSLPPRLLPSLPLPLSPSVSVSLLLSLSLSLPLFLARALSLACLFCFCTLPARRLLAVVAACVLHVVCGWRC